MGGGGSGVAGEFTIPYQIHVIYLQFYLLLYYVPTGTSHTGTGC